MLFNLKSFHFFRAYFEVRIKKENRRVNLNSLKYWGGWKDSSVLALKGSHRKCFLFLWSLTIGGTNREWASLPSTSGQQWTSHHSCSGENSPKKSNTTERRALELLDWRTAGGVSWVCDFFGCCAWKKSFDHHTGCWDALQVTEVLSLFYSLQRSPIAMKGTAHSLCACWMQTSFVVLRPSKGARCAAGCTL